MKRFAGVLVAWTLLAACSGSDNGDEGLVPVDEDGGGTQDGLVDDGGGSGFDIGGDDATFDATVDGAAADTAPGDALVFDSPEDTTCATSEVVAPKPPVDVIIAIDQSGSMVDDVANVKANINKLSDYLNATGLDYRVVMIARVGSSGTDVCVPPPLGGASCASNDPIFRTSNQRILSTDALVRILQTYDSTAAGVKWADVLRPDAFKAIIPITDDNATSGPSPTPIHVTFDNEILKRGSGTFGTKTARKYAAFPICGANPADTTKKCGSTMVNTGKIYVDLATLTGGKVFPLCAKDFGPLFTDIAKSIATKVACEVGVPTPPAGEIFDPGKVAVLYTPSSGGSGVSIARDESKPCDAGANGWQYSTDGKKILLCGTACTGLKSDPGGKVSVVFGCAGKTPPTPDAGSCIGFGAACGDGGTCCEPLSCLPGPDGTPICRAKGPA